MIRKFLVLMGLAALAGAAVLTVESRHEIERYLKISRM
ncbi:DUF6893 family small protein [Pseudonocardia sp. H11422]